MANEEVCKIKVLCRGERHTILLKGGKLGFPDHDMKQEWAFAALGGSCRCLDILKLWRRGFITTLPKKLREKMIIRAELTKRRRSRRELASALDCGGVPFTKFKVDYHTATVRAASQVISVSTRYPELRRRDVIGLQVVVGGDKPSIELKKGNLCIRLGWLWHRNIYQEYLANLDGFFVLAVVNKDPLHVLVAEEIGKPPKLARVEEHPSPNDTGFMWPRLVWL